jgi:hypothetical protein
VIVDGWAQGDIINSGPYTGDYHGEVTTGISNDGDCNVANGMTGSTISSTMYNVSGSGQPCSPTGDAGWDTNRSLMAIGSAVYYGLNHNKVATVNLSMQPFNSLPQGVDHHGLATPEVTAAKNQFSRFFDQIFRFLNLLEEFHPKVLDHLVLNLAAGNYGLDLSNELLALKTKYPKVWDHVIIAGGLDSNKLGNDKKLTTLNTSNNIDDMLYAPMPSGLMGTSFAAPQFTCLTKYLAENRPNLTSAQIKEALFAAAPVTPVLNGYPYRTIPTIDQLLAKADELFPPGGGGGDGGDGGSCTTANDCPGNAICVATRVCVVSALGGSCDCNKDSPDPPQCVDFTGTAAPNPNTCTLEGGSCFTVANCCRGLSCNNGKCEGPSGRCPFTLN